MSFKIVQTIEKGRYVLSTVPENWECDSVLRWPKHKNEKLRRQSYSIPEENWLSMNCIVKRKKLDSFEQAESEIRAMSDMSDTDLDISDQNMRRKCKIIQNMPVTFNDLARKCVENQMDKSTDIASKTKSDICEFLILNQLKEQQASTTNNNNNDMKKLSTILSRIDSKVDNLINVYSSVAQDQSVLSKNQEVILLKLTEISAQFDEFVKRTPSTNQSPTEKLSLTRIGNEESLNEFENSLQDNQIAAEMTKNYSVICGTGKGRAINNAYALIDAMFERNFLKQCSWAGGSRSNQAKICFKSYKRIINFFFKLIHNSDKQFTMLECESFFKKILRNAKKRCDAKQLKASRIKQRSKKNLLGKTLAQEKNEQTLALLNKECESTVPINKKSESDNDCVNVLLEPSNSKSDNDCEYEPSNQELDDGSVNEQFKLGRETEV